MLDDYNSINNELDAIYDHIGEVIEFQANLTDMITAKNLFL